MSDDVVELYVDGKFWTRMSRELFELEYAASRPLYNWLRALSEDSATDD